MVSQACPSAELTLLPQPSASTFDLDSLEVASLLSESVPEPEEGTFPAGQRHTQAAWTLPAVAPETFFGVLKKGFELELLSRIQRCFGVKCNSGLVLLWALRGLCLRLQILKSTMKKQEVGP